MKSFCHNNIPIPYSAADQLASRLESHGKNKIQPTVCVMELEDFNLNEEMIFENIRQ